MVVGSVVSRPLMRYAVQLFASMPNIRTLTFTRLMVCAVVDVFFANCFSWRWRKATRSTPCFTRPEGAFLALRRSLLAAWLFYVVCYL
uniref:Uncharacterized protein n=1 Tax=Triticum urartu TaxID=4572 RepID=A0A8R7PXY4_TRIUA